MQRRDLLKSAAALALAGRAFAADSRKEKIGMIGSGNVGSALGRVWADAGHEVMFSSRNLDSDKKLVAEIGKNARAGSPREAAAFGEVLVFAVPYGALPDLGKSLAGAIKGKVAIDACNPFPQRDGEIANRAREQGAGVVSAELLPGARCLRLEGWIQCFEIRRQRILALGNDRFEVPEGAGKAGAVHL